MTEKTPKASAHGPAGFRPTTSLALALLALALPMARPAAAQPDDLAQAAGGAEPPPAASAYGPMLVGSAEGERLMEDGRAALLAFRLADAEAAFRRLAADDAGRPAARFHLATLALWRALMTEREPFYGRFFAANDSLADALDALPDSPWKTYLAAEGQLQRAVALGKQERYAQAALAMRRACNGFEGVTRRHPDFEEAYKGAGVCHVVAGSIPRQYRWVARLLGFGGTTQQGLAELDRARTRSRYSREEAAVTLALVDAGLNEGRGGTIAHVRALHEQHPTSPVTAYAYGLLLLRERRAADAEAVLRQAVERQAGESVEDIPYLDYYLALALFRQNRFDEAAPLFERYARTYRGQALLAQAHLQAGLAREMLGERAAAVAHYEQVRAERDLDGDLAARREAARRAEAPMNDAEQTLLEAQNLFDAGRYREAVRAAQPVLTDNAALPAHRAEAAYRSGRAYHALEEWAEALRHYQLAVDNPGDPRAKWGPWSRYHTGEVYEAQGDRAAARASYRAVLEVEEEFDFHRSLEQRAKTALGRL